MDAYQSTSPTCLSFLQKLHRAQVSIGRFDKRCIRRIGEVTFEIQITCIYFEGALLTRGKRSGQNSIGDNYHGITFANESNTVDGSGDLDGGHCVASKAGVVVTSDSACLTFLQCIFKCLFSSVL